MTEILPEPTRKGVQRRSVQEFPNVLGGSTFILASIANAATAADEAPAWWTPSRDEYLDRFWKQEPFLAGAIYAVAARNASFRWELTGPADDVEWAHNLFVQAGFGEGWQNFILKVTLDVLCSDNGGFIEVIRPARARSKSGHYFDAIKVPDPDTGQGMWQAYDASTGKFLDCTEYEFKITDNPFELPIGLAHLDSHRCTRTGNPDTPVIYSDIKGRRHKLAFHQVITLEDMPSPRAQWYGVGTCAVTRCLRLAQILRDMSIYKQEKVSGRFTRAIHLTNVDAEMIQDAIEQHNTDADNRALTRYMQPVVLATLDPNARPTVATIPLASLPDGFSEEETMRWYIAGVANALGVDYGFLAPLPGNKLGTSTQAETQERQSRGKSSRLFMEALTYKFNWSGILPQTTTFKFTASDPEEESERDRAFARRARAYNTLIQSNVLSPELARQMLADSGDIDPRYLELLGETDLTPITTVSGTDVQVERPQPSRVISQRLIEQLQQQAQPEPAPNQQDEEQGAQGGN
jgi:hypothetical protein